MPQRLSLHCCKPNVHNEIKMLTVRQNRKLVDFGFPALHAAAHFSFSVDIDRPCFDTVIGPDHSQSFAVRCPHESNDRLNATEAVHFPYFLSLGKKFEAIGPSIEELQRLQRV